MSSRKSLFIVGLSLICLSLVGLIGCGGDDKTTSNTGNLLSGDDYNAASSNVNTLVDSTLTVVTDGLNTILVGIVDEDVAQLPGLFYTGVNPGTGGATTDGEWIVVTATDLSTGIAELYVDSLQFLRDGQVTSGSAAADAMTMKHLWSKRNGDTTMTHTDYELVGQLDFTNLDQNVASVSGTKTFTVDSKIVGQTNTEWKDYTVEATLEELTFDRAVNGWALGCPTSGTVSVDLTYTYQLDDATPVETEYSFEVSFTSGSAEVEVSSASKVNQYSVDFCSISASN